MVTAPTVYVSGNGTGDYNVSSGDASRNAQNAINQAIAYAHGHSGYTTVYLKGPFTYWISSPIQIYSNLILKGDKSAEVKLISAANWVKTGDQVVAGNPHDGVSHPLIEAAGNWQGSVSNIEIAGFTIDGNHDGNFSSSSPTTISGSYRPKGWGYYNHIHFWNGSSNIKVHQMTFRNGHGDGLRIQNSSNIQFYNNIISKLGHEGVFVLRSSNIRIYDNECEIRTDSFARCNDCTDAEIYNNKAHALGGWDSGNAAVQIERQYNATIGVKVYDNIFYNTNGPGIWIVNNNAVSNSNSNVEIFRNQIYNCGLNANREIYYTGGVCVCNIHGVKIYNNVIDGCYGFGVGTHATGSDSTSSSVSGVVVTVKNNIITNTKTRVFSPSGTGYGIQNGLANHTVNSSYNDNYKSATGAYGGSIGVKTGDINKDPLFVNQVGQNYHLRSTAGHYDSSTGNWVKDTAMSPCIDAGDPADAFANEPTGNGNRINMGCYGNTQYASKTTDTTPPPPPEENPTTFVVTQDPAFKDKAGYYYTAQGVSDANVAINAAIKDAGAKATAAAPLTVYIKAYPPGAMITTYKISDHIYFDAKKYPVSNVTLQGEDGVVIKLAEGLKAGKDQDPWGWKGAPYINRGAAIQLFNGATNIRLTTFSINGSWDDIYKSSFPTRAQNEFVLININNSHDIKIDHLGFFNGMDDGILAADGADKIEVCYCSFNKVGYDCMECYKATNVKFHHNYCVMRTGCGIRLNGSSNGAEIYDNEFTNEDSGQSGIIFGDDGGGPGNSIKIHHNYFHNITGSFSGGIGYAGETPIASDTQIFNNLLTDNNFGINANIPTNTVLKNNIATRNTGVGIYLNQGSSASYCISTGNGTNFSGPGAQSNCSIENHTYAVNGKNGDCNTYWKVTAGPLINPTGTNTAPVSTLSNPVITASNVANNAAAAASSIIPQVGINVVSSEETPTNAYTAILADPVAAPNALAAGARITVTSFTGAGIQAAINSAGSGDTVYLPAGTYTMGSGLITLKSNITITGTGESTLLQGNSSTGGGMSETSQGWFNGSGLSNVEISYLNFKGSASGTTDGGHGEARNLIVLKSCSNCLIHHNIITPWHYDDFVKSHSGTNIKVYNNAGQAAHDFTEFLSGSRNCEFFNNKVNIATNCGIRSDGASGTKIYNNEFFGDHGSGWCCVELESGNSSCTITKNIFHDFHGSSGNGAIGTVRYSGSHTATDNVAWGGSTGGLGSGNTLNPQDKSVANWIAKGYGPQGTITPPPSDNKPVAGFNYSPQSGKVPLAVTFNCRSTGPPTSWDWDFGDGSTHAKTSDTTHTYTRAGTFTVKLTVANSGGSDSISYQVKVNAADSNLPSAIFSTSPLSGPAPLTVNFTDQSTGNPTSYSWDFGDNSTKSTDKSPTHVFTTAGSYTITLTVSNTSGSSSAVQKIRVDPGTTNGAPVASFTVDKDNGAAPLTVKFTNTSSGLN
jgi:PKD repeat protein